VILNLAIWFALHTLFARTRAFASGPIQLDVPVLASIDWAAVALAAAALIAVFRFRLGTLWVLAGCAAAGLAMRLVLPA
jgi:chromate transporter